MMLSRFWLRIGRAGRCDLCLARTTEALDAKNPAVARKQANSRIEMDPRLMGNLSILAIEITSECGKSDSLG
jgi:hypothetical protein